MKFKVIELRDPKPSEWVVRVYATDELGHTHCWELCHVFDNEFEAHKAKAKYQATESLDIFDWAIVA